MALLTAARSWPRFVLAAGTGRAAQSRAPAAAPTEYEVKAAFLYNFARFVEWPPESAGARSRS